MTSSATQNKSLRHRLRERLNRVRHSSRDSSDHASISSNQGTQVDPSLEAKSISISFLSSHANSASSLDSAPPHATPTPTSRSLDRAHHVRRESITFQDDAGKPYGDQSALLTLGHISNVERSSTANFSTIGVDSDAVTVTPDIWSSAYREAVESLGKDIDVAILKGENVAQLFKKLEEIDVDATQESVFLRGVRYLHSLQVPLENLRLVLDLATPLANVEPTVATVFGVVKSVTAIAISIATADLEFAKHIGEMLEQLQYIDDCDTLGQKTNKLDIHSALVSIYKKLLEFYIVAFEILTRRGAKLVMRMVLENDRLPNIVQEFLRLAGHLRKLIQKATLEIVQEIKVMLYDREIATWLGGGKMSQQSKYHSDLQELRADKACEFLLADAKFINWYQTSDSQLLIILGNMGCGKSVAMAFLSDELERRNKYQIPQPKICYHYCRDDETGQPIYVFSALILSLLQKFNGLKRTFFEWYKHAGASGNFEPATHFKKLEEFLHNTLKTLDRPLFIVIDGLDECDAVSQKKLLDSMKVLSKTNPRLKVILSSRPHEEILEQLDGMTRIDLSPNAERDKVIVEKTVDGRLFNLTKDVRALVIETLSRLAQGSAIWTKMTVELIEVRKIRALGPMRDFLKDVALPQQLSDLYVNIFSRCTSNDSQNQVLATKALEVLAICRRPLSIAELAWAVALGAAQKEVTTVAALENLVDSQRVIRLIQPFIAHVDFGDIKKRQVRLVHQSVKEFIIREWNANWPDLRGQAASKSTAQGPSHQRIGRLEAVIFDICIKYLLLDDFGQLDLFSEEQIAIIELPQEFDLFSNDEEPTDYDPFWTWDAWEENMARYDPADRGFGELFVYASCHWIEHFAAVAVEPLPDLKNIENLCQAGSTRLQNWIKQNCRPQCTIKPRFVFDSTLYDPLSITSLYGSEAMLRNMLQNSDFDSRKFLPDPAMGAADQILQWGDLSRLKILLTGNSISHQVQNLEFFRMLMRQWSVGDSRHRDWDVIPHLVDDVLDVLAQERWGNELLCTAASAGCMPIIRRLLERAQQKPELKAELLRASSREPRSMAFGKPKHQSIGEAVLGNHVDVVEYLLGQPGIEAHLRYRNSRGENVLHLASRVCNPAMFRLLVPRFQEGLRQTNEEEETVLAGIIKHCSASQERSESAQILLLESSAKGDDRSGDDQDEALRIAVALGDLEMCRLLISIGKMNPLSVLRRDDNGKISLKEETFENDQNMAAILELLRTHADPEWISGPKSLLTNNESSTNGARR